jgi:hypothetical protein
VSQSKNFWGITKQGNKKVVSILVAKPIYEREDCLFLLSFLHYYNKLNGGRHFLFSEAGKGNWHHRKITVNP